MNLADAQLRRLDDPTLTREQRTLLRCQIAAELIHTGKYVEAGEALGEFWQGVGKRPDLKGLATAVAAEVLLQSGTLTGWLGSVRSIPDAQEKAKDFLTEALRKFQSQSQHAKVSEVRYELGLCYFRLGSYDEARIVLDEAAISLGDEDAQLKAKVLIRRSFIEIWTSKHHDALSVLEKAREFFESCNDALKGRWHGQMGLVMVRLATAEGSSDYADRAIIEFTAAAFHFELANHQGYSARALNNLAFLLYKLGRYAEAHENLDRAAAIFHRLKDESSLAQVSETRARVLVAEQRYREANRVLSEVIPVFEKGSEYALLADAFTIQGVAWARLRAYDSSLHILRRAISVAHDAGALSNAGLAALTLIEEHGDTRLPEGDLSAIYRRADEWLKNTQDAEEIARLRACARILARRLSVSHAKMSDGDFSLPNVVLAYEGRFIERALELEHGVLTRAAKRLGISRQWLSYLLDTRHRNLRQKRKPAGSHRERRPTSTREPRRTGAARKAKPLSILVVEDDLAVRDVLKDTLEAEGWRVRVCVDAAAGQSEIGSVAHYDLLVLDQQLGGNVSGIELARFARSLAHRRQTPVVVFSASYVERAAKEAGADVFLRKPQDVGRIVETVRGLIRQGREG